MPITQKRLKEVLDYDPETGIFTWIADHYSSKAGNQAGTPNGRGYIRVGIDGRRYCAHRLAWLFVTGEFPKNQIAHRNLIKSDNQWNNLREATGSQNKANRNLQSNNTTGVKGIYYIRARRCWRAEIVKDRKNYFLGHFQTKEEARAARRAMEPELFGEFAR